MIPSNSPIPSRRFLSSLDVADPLPPVCPCPFPVFFPVEEEASADLVAAALEDVAPAVFPPLAAVVVDVTEDDVATVLPFTPFAAKEVEVTEEDAAALALELASAFPPLPAAAEDVVDVEAPPFAETVK